MRQGQTNRVCAKAPALEMVGEAKGLHGNEAEGRLGKLVCSWGPA